MFPGNQHDLIRHLVRRLSRGLAVAAALVVLPALVITGCGGSTSEGESSEALNDAQTVFTTPEASGELSQFSWNLPNGEPTSLDWIKAYGDSENTVLANVCESLQRQNPDFSITDGVASFDRVDDKTFVYKIDPKVTFSDGSPLTAEDVAFSLSRNLDPDLGSYWAAPFYNNVKSIDASGEREVTVHLKQPDALFNRMMATAAGAVGQKKYVQAKGSAYGTANGGVMCTGPFSLESWKPGSEIVLKRNDDYWNQDLAAKAKQVTFRFITDESTLTSALVSGSIDGEYAVPQASVPQLQGSASGKLVFGAGTQFVGLRPTERKGLLKDLKVRKALSLAVDRAAIAKVIFNNSGVPSVTPVQPAQWGYAKSVFEAASKELPSPDQDLEEARKLVKEAGSPSGAIKVAVNSDQSYLSQTAQTIKSAANEVGLNVKIQGLTTNVLNNLYYDKGARADYDGFIVQEYGAAVADPIVTLSEFTPLSDYNYGALDVPEITNSIRDAMGTYDDERRAELVTKAQASLVENVGVINLVNQLNSVYQNNRVTGAPASLAFLYYPWAAKVGAP